MAPTTPRATSEVMMTGFLFIRDASEQEYRLAGPFSEIPPFYLRYNNTA
jgi:hypothetical protein